MPKGPAPTTDDIADTIRSLIDRVADAKVTQEMTRRGQEVAAVLADRGGEVGDRATEVWRDTRPLRRDAARRVTRASVDAARWSDRTWRRALRPALKDAWKRRTLAIGAAGAAVPAGRELVDTAAARLGLRQREERHWGIFFLGLLLGAAIGAIAALLTTPKRGSEMRRELGVRAEEARRELSERAREAEWVPMFQRDEATNGHSAPTYAVATDATDATDAPDATGSVQEGAAESGTATDEVVDAPTPETAEVVNDSAETMERSADTVERESA